jgi:hypothetical protein
MSFIMNTATSTPNNTPLARQSWRVRVTVNNVHREEELRCDGG